MTRSPSLYPPFDPADLAEPECLCDVCVALSLALSEHALALARVRGTRTALEEIARAVDARHHLDARAYERRTAS